MKDSFKVFCVNNGKEYEAQLGTTLAQILEQSGIKTVKEKKSGIRSTPITALVDNKLKSFDYRLTSTCMVEFIGLPHPDARRTYIRSLCFVLQKAVRDLFPDKVLVIDHFLPSGLYCELRETGNEGTTYFITDAEVQALKERMQQIIKADLNFGCFKLSQKEAQDLFKAQSQPDKAELIHSLGRYFWSIYTLDDIKDTFHGPLVPSTGYLKVFDLTGFNDGFCLLRPSMNDISKVSCMRRQSKIAATYHEYSRLCSAIGINNVGNLNHMILSGDAVSLINLSEARQERDYAQIADRISASYAEKRIILISGPSSSGKTSSSLRIAQQCRLLGLQPKVIELDNYFVNREDTPLDEHGAYDFEHLHAMDLDLLNLQLNQLLDGQEVNIPKFDFSTGKRSGISTTLSLTEKSILIMEGIHALNPEMVSNVDQSRVFRVYASALTSLNLDENNVISTSDNRLLRRIIRDSRVRSITPEETISRWDSVRRGEERNIFPFQENADVLFNSALLYELPLLKHYVEPLLMRIQPNSPAYSEAVRLLKFLGFIVPLKPSEIAAIPPTSIMREFIGGQTL